jgi:hypothetical protein
MKPCPLMLLQLLLLLLAAARPTLSGFLDSYIVDPSYLDVSNQPGSKHQPQLPSEQQQQQAASRRAATASCSNSSTDGACVHAGLLPLQEQGPARTPWPHASTHDMQESSSTSTGISNTASSTSREPPSAWPAHSRLLQAAAANPLRLQAPYNVCVSSWAPMVRCQPGAEQADFKGGQQAQLQLPGRSGIALAWKHSCLPRLLHTRQYAPVHLCWTRA